MNISHNVFGWYSAPQWQRTLVGAITIAALVLWAVGPLQFARAANGENPTLPQSCGLDIALVLDSSGSVNATELGQMKTAFNGFVSAFLPATPTLFSVTDFDNNGVVLQQFTSNTTLLTTAINTPTSGGNTNWEDALADAYGTFGTSGTSKPNLIVFASDGAPTRRVGNTQSGFQQADLDAAVAQANVIKDAGTRIITLGIGIDAAGVTRMKAISSEDAYYDASSFSTLAATLQTLADDLCGGTVTVHKVIDQDGDTNTTNDQSPGVGWTFTIDGNQYVTDEFGDTAAVQILHSNAFDIVETQQANHSIVGASCTGSSGSNGSQSNDSVTGVSLGSLDVVSCTFYNHPAPGTLTVYKQVVNNDEGTSVADDFTIEVSGGSPSSFAGSESGTSVQVPGGASFSVTESNPGNYEVSYQGTCSGTMAPGGTASCTVVNDDLGPGASSLTLIKEVINDDDNDFTGPIAPSAWTLTATGPTSFSGPGPTVLSSSVDPFTEGTYDLSESGPGGYTASAWVCTGGTQVDGDTVTVGAGQVVSCTITNNDNPLPACSNHVDDGDSEDALVDEADPGCHSDGNPDNAESYTPSDNDETDPLPPAPQCSNDVDDGDSEDTLVDENDPGCHTDGDAGNSESYDPNDNDEQNTVVEDESDEDVCSNIEGVQTQAPEGQQVEGNGECHNIPNQPPTGGGGGGGNGPLIITSGGGGGGGGFVLGASTQGQVLGESCGLYMNKHLRRGSARNDSTQTGKLQAFLIKHGFLKISAPTNYFGPQTEAAVHAFQNQYASGILTPWNLTASTGLVYLSTLRQINLIECPELSIKLPPLVPWSQNPAAQ